MAVAKTTNEVKLAIERKTAKTLPDQPTARGYTAATIKGTLYKWLSDPTNSLFAELDRIVDAFNAEIADVTDKKSNLAGGNTFTGDQTFTGDVIVEEDIEVDGDIVAKGDITADGYVTGKFGIDANDKVVSRVATPILNTDAPNKKYVDDADALKVDKTSIIDNLTTGDTTKVLSAKQGKVLQDTKEELTNKATDFSVLNDTKYPTTKAVKDLLDATVGNIDDILDSILGV
jgi:hypothetical protein